MIEGALGEVQRRIRVSCEKAGRDPSEITLVLVTKQVEPKRILEAYRLGHRHFGENKVQEFVSKQNELPKDIDWHLVGSLQTNKVKWVVGSVALIHSCDRLDLAEALQKQAEKTDRNAKILIQVNTSRETTKHGFSVDDVEETLVQMERLGRLKILGLMTIGPNTDNVDRIRSAFRTLRCLRDQLKKNFPKHDWRYLSMGMSSDFEAAVEEGANIIRIGSAVFGERKGQA